MKICTKCKQEKPLSEYSHKRAKNRKPGLQPRCKACAAEDTRIWNEKNRDTARDRYLQRQYGITESEYNARLVSQNNCCLLCKVEFNHDVWGGNSPVVDHCHTHGHVRGILCNECNRGLGYFHDNIGALMNAIKYLSGEELTPEGGQQSCLLCLMESATISCKKELNWEHTKKKNRVKDRAQRNAARAAVKKKVGASALQGKDVGHKKAVSKGGKNSLQNLFLQSPASNRSFSRNADGSMKSEISKKERKKK